MSHITTLLSIGKYNKTPNKNMTPNLAMSPNYTPPRARAYIRRTCPTCHK